MAMDMATVMDMEIRGWSRRKHCSECIMRGMDRIVRIAICLLIGGGFWATAEAAEWKYSDGILFGAAFTDNVRLSETKEESSLAGVLTPHFQISGKGRRVSTKVSAAFQLVTDSDQILYPDIRGNLNSELVKSRFFVDAFFDAYQASIDPLRPAGSPIHKTGNLTTKYSIGINPYWKEHFGSFADLRIDYLYEKQIFDGGDDQPDNRDFNDFYFSLSSGRYFRVFTWNIRGAYEDTAYQDDSKSDTTFRSLDISLGYILTRHLKPYFSFGREWNTYEGSGGRRGGNKWLVGTRWTPNQRVNLDIGYGYRFFGHYPFVDLSYRHRRSVLRLRYTQDIGSGYYPRGGRNFYTSRSLPGTSSSLASTSASTTATSALEGGVGGTTVDEVDGTGYNGAYVDERFLLGYYLKGLRTTFSADVNYSDKRYAGGNPDYLKWIVGLNIGRRLEKNLFVDARTSFEHTNSESGLEADTWKLRFGVSRKLGSYTHVRFSYTYANRDSNRVGDSYDENRLALTINTSLSKMVKHADF